MKFMAKKSASVLLAIVLCFGLIFGVNVPVMADNVDYVYSGDYIYNWGERGEVATFLSQNAESFYEDNNTSYAELSALPGGSTESAVPSSALYKKLHNLMESNHDYKTSYDATKDLFKYTDCQNNGGKISSFYSGKEIGPSWNGDWNREHTWPNSKGDKSGNGENDLMMLRPTASSENSSRGNKAYGQSGGYYNPNNESNGKYDLRGDVARIVLYVYVRWECTNTGSGYNPNGIFGTDGVFESKELLLDWMEADPVDTWELGRNDSAESILGTRNVFVDYPELAFLLYNEEIPVDYETPSGSAEGTRYTIAAQSNNTTWGTVSVTGKTVNATPKTGYEVAGYELLSGDAIVTRNGNSFSINASSDVEIKVNFAPRSQKSVKFLQDGDGVDTKTVYSGDEITLPAYSGTLPEGNTFVGWVEQAVEETNVVPQFYNANSKYTVTSDKTFFALYSKTVNDGGSTSNSFEKFSGTFVEGDYLIVYDGVAMKAGVSSSRFTYSDVTDINDTITNPDVSLVWTVSADGSYYTLYNKSVEKYAASTGSKNKGQLLSSVDDKARWSVSGTSTYEFVNKYNNENNVNSNLRRNGTYGFATYAQSTGGALTLYKRVAGTIYYFTSISAPCSHQNAYDMEETAPTCSEDGYTAGVYCPDCEEYISGHDVIETEGHTYSSDCDNDCNTCGAVRNILVVHTLNYDYVCTTCGAVSQEYIVADVNNDSKINNRDYVIIMRYINGWDIECTVNAADVNNDGKLNNMDIAFLMQYLNGWDVKLGS